MRRFVPALLFFLGGCGGPDVAFNTSYQFSNLKRVAVASFEGPRGRAAADYLAHELLASGADVVERNRLEAVLSEHRLGSGGALNPNTVREIGRLAGVDGLFLGSVTQLSLPQNFLVVATSTTLSSVPASPVGSGSVIQRGPAFGAEGTSIVTSAAQVGLTARLVDVETGTVVWSAHQSYEGFDVDSAMSAISSSFVRSLSRVWQREK